MGSKEKEIVGVTSKSTKGGSVRNLVVDNVDETARSIERIEPQQIIRRLFVIRDGKVLKALPLIGGVATVAGLTLAGTQVANAQSEFGTFDKRTAKAAGNFAYELGDGILNFSDELASGAAIAAKAIPALGAAAPWLAKLSPYGWAWMAAQAGYEGWNFSEAKRKGEVSTAYLDSLDQWTTRGSTLNTALRGTDMVLDKVLFGKAYGEKLASDIIDFGKWAYPWIKEKTVG